MDAKTREMIEDDFEYEWLSGTTSRVFAELSTRSDPPEFYKAVAHCAYCAVLSAFIEKVEKGPKWIPVEQEFPPLNQQTVLIFSPSTSEANMGKWNGKEWYVWGVDGFDIAAWIRYGLPVTHWMPLPPQPTPATETAAVPQRPSLPPLDDGTHALVAMQSGTFAAERAIRLCRESQLSAALEREKEKDVRINDLQLSNDAAAGILGAVCVYGTITPSERPVDPPEHAAVSAILHQIHRAAQAEAERDRLREALVRIRKHYVLIAGGEEPARQLTAVQIVDSALTPSAPKEKL